MMDYKMKRRHLSAIILLVLLLGGGSHIVLRSSRNPARAAPPPRPAAQSGGITTRVSVTSDSTQGNGQSLCPAISSAGHYVAFTSAASNLAEGDTNGVADTFVHDRQTGQTRRVSVASDGTQANGRSTGCPAISADGRYVAFASEASNLVPDDTNGYEDVFVHDWQTGETTRVSVASDGTQANGRSGSFYPPFFISADGRYVAFMSGASNLVPDDTNGTYDVCVHDRQTGETTRVSVASDGTQGDSTSMWPSISADGRYVAFASAASNLVPSDTNGSRDTFVHDRQTGQTTRVSVASDGTQGDGYSSPASGPAISADGRYVAFESAASNLVPGDTNIMPMLVHDRQTGQTTRISVASDGTQANNSSYCPAISADGRYVAFASLATNLVSGDTNGQDDVFLHDLQTGETSRVSVASNGTQGNGDSLGPAISADGRYVAFESDATNLVTDDTNGYKDVFLHDRETGQTTRVSVGGPTCEGDLVVLVHGRGGDPSSFGDLEQWLHEDGFCVGAVNGITPAKTLDDNARDILMPQIDQIRNYLGYGPEDKVIIVAHSLGGLVTRAYVESGLYRGDIQRIFLLGSPNGGVDPGVLGFLLNILGPWCLLVNPADCQISQPGMVLFNLTHLPNTSVAYYLIAGNAGELHPLSLLTPLKPDDRVVTEESVHAIGGSTVWKYETSDCHSNTWVGALLWNCASAYFLPRATYDACIRPRLIGQPVTGCTEVSGVSVAVASASGSNVATTPFTTDVITTTQTVTHTITIDNTGDTHFYLIWSEGHLDFTLTDPANNLIDPVVADTDPDIEFLSVPAAEIPTNMQVYSITNAAAGQWQVHVTGVDTGGQQVSLVVFALLETPLSFSVATDSDWYPQGGTVGVTASLRDLTSGVSGATVEAEFVRPDGASSTLALFDDGLHNDGAAGDGTYGNTYTDTSVGGYYSVNASAGGTYNSVAFERGAETVFTVSTNAASLTGAYNDYPEDADSNGKFESLVLEVGVNVNQDGDYALALTVEDGVGQLIDQTVNYETLSTGPHTVLIRFDGQAILEHNVDGPYTVSQVVLSDITGASVLLEEAQDVHTTAAYDHTIFGNDWLIYLPLIMKNH